MKYELNIINLANDDVIATSSCGSSYLLYKNGDKYYVWKNHGTFDFGSVTPIGGYDLSGTFSVTFPQYVSGYSDGFYHYDSNGNISKCDTWNADDDNKQEVCEAHGVNYPTE